MKGLKKRILHVVDWLGGGIERFVCDIITGTSDKYSHSLIFRHYNGNERQQLERMAIPIAQIPPGALFFQLFHVYGVSERLRPAIIHVHSASMMPCVVLNLLKLSTPIVYTEQGEMQFLNGSNRYRRFVRWAIKRCKIVSPSSLMAGRLKEFTQLCRDDSLFVIHNGVEVPPRANPYARQLLRYKIGVKDDELLLCYVGQLERIKGVEYLLRAIHAIRLSKAKTVLIGDGRERKFLTELTEELGITGDVRFMGNIPHPEVLSILQSSDIFISPSISDGLGIALLEAMAAGLPVIATAVGGRCEAIRNMETGILVPAADAAALGRAILDLAESPQLRKNLGEGARKTIEAEFSIQNMIEQYSVLYANLSELKG